MAILKKIQVPSQWSASVPSHRQTEASKTDIEPLRFDFTTVVEETRTPVKLSTSLLLQWISETATSHANMTWSLKGPPSATIYKTYVPVRTANRVRFPGSAGTGVDLVGGALMGRHAGEIDASTCSRPKLEAAVRDLEATREI
jgi:hypothetical protein